ncbi:MAG TPA: hypothetical protein VHA14_01895 [Bryobacteraceae bacterium]|nr:hypothetical protein [Bryobacteraceae bacterium]
MSDAANSHVDISYETRLRKLERERRWTRIALIAMAVIFAVSFSLTRTRDYSRVSAHEFDLSDSNGRTRAKLALTGEGAGLTMYAASGEERAELSGGGENAGLSLYLPVTASSPSSGGVRIFDGKKQVAELSGGPASTVLSLGSASGTGVASIVVNDELATMTIDGNPVEGSGLTFEASRYASCLLAQGNEQESQRTGVSMCSDSLGQPSLMLNGRDGEATILGVAPGVYRQPRATWGSSAASSAMIARNGKVLWAQPR